MLLPRTKITGQYLVITCVLVGYLYWTFPHPALFSSNASRDCLDDIANSTLGFERIYVINLASRTDRRDGLVLMSALTDLDLHWVNGVDGNDVAEKALPPPASHDTMKSANIGSWRAHLNALQAVVANHLGSALILEDDADWDVRIKSQLQDFALTSRALLQPDSTFHNSRKTPLDINFDRLPPTVSPRLSPYGDDWDVLWLGHCGTQFPNPSDSEQPPSRRVVHYNDHTVPQNEYLQFMSEEDDPRKTYPPHTRITHHVTGSICSLGYAVSQRGARRLLYELGVKKFDGAFDVLLRDVCEGVNGRSRGTCLTVQPQLFNHHRPAGHSTFYSDISVHEEQMVEKPSTYMIRWSTRINLLQLIEGRADFEDQWPDMT